MNRFFLYFGGLILIAFSGCFFGSLSQFSDEEIAGKENLIPNSGFEEGTYNYDILPEHWLIVNKPHFEIFWDRTNGFAGEKSLKIQSPSEEINLFSDAFNIDPGAIYYSRCFVKSNRQNAAPVTLYFLAFNLEGKKVNRFSSKIIPKQEWTEINLSSGFLKGDALFGRVVISFPKSKDVTYWIDNVETYEVYKLRKRWSKR